MSIVIVKPGLLTTIQDRGRRGYRHLGIRAAGVMDPVASRVANLLAGNKENATVLETTLLGPTLRFEQSTWIGLAGAEFMATLDGQPILNNARHWITAAQTLELKHAVQGCRGYLAVEQGFDVPMILGSSSTDLRSGWGGQQGRALQAGDVLKIVAGTQNAGWPGAQRSGEPGTEKVDHPQSGSAGASPSQGSWSVELPVKYSVGEHTIPIVRGSEADWFTPGSWRALLDTPYTITPQSDRMGYRLQGETLSLAAPRELLSAASLRGNLQVPANGQPILLMADHPTTGGYPVIATAAMAAWPLLAQAKPGDRLRFVEVTRAAARQMLVEQELAIRKLARAIELRQK